MPALDDTLSHRTLLLDEQPWIDLDLSPHAEIPTAPELLRNMGYLLRGPSVAPDNAERFIPAYELYHQSRSMPWLVPQIANGLESLEVFHETGDVSGPRATENWISWVSYKSGT